MARKNEAQERAEVVSKRRSAAAALVTDLDTEFADVRISVELDGPGYTPADQKSLTGSLDKARQLLEKLYVEVQQISFHPVSDRITEPEAYALMQPALKIEAMAVELRQWLQRVRDAKSKLDRPKTEVDGQAKAAEVSRLNVSAGLDQARMLIEQMRQARAENYPECSAALLTAEREATAANQLLVASQQALGRYAYREALDLTQRARSMLDSAQSKLDMIKAAGVKFEKAHDEADDALNKALARLQEAKQELTQHIVDLEADPNTYFFGAVQRIGEARRAIKSDPPQNLTCYRLSNEALTMIEDALQRARQGINTLREGRVNSHSLLHQLQETVYEVRLRINEKQAVPVRAKELYSQARSEFDRLAALEIQTLSLTEMEDFTSSATYALKLAESARALL
jgi:hypothetical protein